MRTEVKESDYKQEECRDIQSGVVYCSAAELYISYMQKMSHRFQRLLRKRRHTQDISGQETHVPTNPSAVEPTPTENVKG